MFNDYVEYSFEIETPLYRKVIIIMLVLLGLLLMYCSIYLPVVMTIGMFFIALAFLMVRSNNLEYEYILIEDELSFYKIIGKSKRKKMGVVDLKELECMMKNGKEIVDMYKHKKVKIKRFYSKKNNDPIYALMLERGGMITCLLINADTNLVDVLKRRYPTADKIKG